MTTPGELFDLTGRVALVTGGSRGLGREMVLGLARAGADVVISSRKLAPCQELAALVETEYGCRALAHACHVGDWQEVEGLVRSAYDAFGKVDVLINNAGMSPLYADLPSVTEALYDKVFAVNLKGPFRLSALVGTRMAAGAGGSIINISTIGSIRPRPDIVPYAAAKAGLNAMTVGLSRAFGPTVRVNCVMPGSFSTDVTKAWSPDVWTAASTLPALQRVGRPEEIIGTVLYLASDASSYTTGAVFPVDGGLP